MTKHPPEGPESTVTENNDRLNGGVDLLAKAMRRVFSEEVEPTLEAEAPPSKRTRPSRSTEETRWAERHWRRKGENDPQS